MCRLGVNIDHVATIRQARGGQEPDPVWAAALAELAGADVITIHLREDRRHIQDRDLRVLRETVSTRLNLEMAVVPAIIELAIQTRPDHITLVPERRQELTTEGGLDIIRNRQAVADAVARLKAAGLLTSLFIDPNPEQVKASADIGADAIELHTGRYGEARGANSLGQELKALQVAGETALKHGLALHAGHGLNYQNVGDVARIHGMAELNIGHSIVSRAVMVGMERAVKEMKQAIEQATLRQTNRG